MYCGDETGSFIGDFGTHSCKFGYGGEDSPKLVIPSYTTHDYKAISFSGTAARKASSEDIIPLFDIACSPSLNCAEYMNDGIINSFKAWESMWDIAFHQLSSYKTFISQEAVSASSTEASSCENQKTINHPLLVTDSGNTHEYSNSKKKNQREKMTEILFETYNIPALFIAPSPMLQAFSMGRQTGVVVDMGAAGSRVTPIVDGLLLQQSQRRNGMGGEWLNAVQFHLLQNSHVNQFEKLNSNLFQNMFRLSQRMFDIKTNTHVSLPLENADHEQDNTHEEDDPEVSSFTLPDGTIVHHSNSSYKQLKHLPTILFLENPLTSLHLSSTSSPTTTALNLPKTLQPETPLPKLIHSSISSVDADVRRELCNNILLCGAHSLFPNLEQKLSHELTTNYIIASNYYKTKVVAPKNSVERRFASWIGASVLTSLGSFQQLWLGKTEYEEYGVLLSCNRFP